MSTISKWSEGSDPLRRLAPLIDASRWRETHGLALREPFGVQITYSELAGIVVGLSNILDLAGGGRSLTVVCRMPGGPVGMAVFLGVAAGHACAPVSASLPTPALLEHVTRVGATAYLTFSEDDAQQVAAELSCPIILGSQRTDPVSFTLYSSGSVPSTVSQVLPTLVLTTSGTTGSPKLVGLHAPNIAAAMSGIAANFRLGPEDCVYCPMPLHHVHGLLSAGLATLVSSGTACMPSSFDAEQVGLEIDACRASWTTMLPGMHQRVLESLSGRWSPARQLRFVRSSSSPLATEAISSIEAFYKAPLYETYGLTETCSLFTAPPWEGSRKAGSVGRPVAGEIRIVPIEQGSDVGEVELRGASVITNYMAGGEGSFRDGWLRTGDFGRLDVDGDLFLTGRLKELVKRQGYKISLGEIDRILSALPEVVDALSCAYSHPRMGEDILAAVRLRQGAAADPTALRQLLFESVAGYKVPSEIVVLDELPRSALGKPDRNALYQALLAREAARPQRPLSTEALRLCHLWKEELGVPAILPDDNLFRLGADMASFRAVLRRLETLGELPVSRHRFLRSSTISEQLSA